jgi:rhodanese-related sulfurtransferase
MAFKVCAVQEGCDMWWGPLDKDLRVRHPRYIVRTVSAPDASDRSAGHVVAGQAGVSIEVLLDDARKGLVRLEPADAHRAAASGAILVDIRPLEQRERDGTIPGALVIDRNVLEWRLDPRSDFRDPSVDSQRRVLIICNEGYSSSLAAATLRLLGREATDVVGGFQKWRECGLPVVR